MAQHAPARTADNRGLVTIGMSLGLAALFAAVMAAALVTSEVQATSAAESYIAQSK